jgi:hypothetical protein
LLDGDEYPSRSFTGLLLQPGVDNWGGGGLEELGDSLVWVLVVDEAKFVVVTVAVGDSDSLLLVIASPETLSPVVGWTDMSPGSIRLPVLLLSSLKIWEAVRVDNGCNGKNGVGAKTKTMTVQYGSMLLIVT